MTSFHHNFGVGESTDPQDQLLHETVADLKDPAPTPVHPPHNFVAPSRIKLHTKGYPISSTEKFVSE